MGKINDLIKIAQKAVQDEIDIRTIYEWKKQTVEYLTRHLGPDHYYTRYFTNYMKEVEQQTLLTGGGLLAAVRETVFDKGRQSPNPCFEELGPRCLSKRSASM
jgi:hypothetical protein